MNTKDKDNTENKLEKLTVVEDNGLKGYGIRHQQCLMLFFCLTTAYSMRSCMGVALVAMVDRGTNINLTQYINVTQLNQMANYTNDIVNGSLVADFSEINDTIIEKFEPNGFFNTLLFTEPYPKFQWSKKWQDVILSSFQWGYMTLQIPAGQLAHRFGARLLLTGALTINCIVSFCIPWAAYYGGSTFMLICRMLQGLSQACILPGLHTFFGKWSPLEERARLTGFVLGGQALGTVLGLPITGFLAASSLGWPGIFRFYGMLSGLIAVLIFYMLADTPAQHRGISAAERQYIEEALGQKGDSKKYLPVPWSRILRSRGMYAIVVAHIGQTWGQLILYAEVPAFMDKVMGVNIKANGLLTALPFLVMWVTNFFFAWMTDMLIVKKILNVTNARKLANSLGCVPAAIGLVMLAYAPKDIYVVESILVGICAFKIAAHVGFQVNHIDISPNFAGTMMSISNFVSNSVGSLAPMVAGFILTDVTSEFLWRKVFFVAAGLYFFTNLVYVLLGTAEKADWNDPPEDYTKDNEKGKHQENEPMINEIRDEQ